MQFLRPLAVKVSEVAQSCPTLCDPVDCSPPGSSVHGILQARILEWVAISFSRGSSRPRDRTQVSCIAGRCFNLWTSREAQSTTNFELICIFLKKGSPTIYMYLGSAFGYLNFFLLQMWWFQIVSNLEVLNFWRKK